MLPTVVTMLSWKLRLQRSRGFAFWCNRLTRPTSVRTSISSGGPTQLIASGSDRRPFPQTIFTTGLAETNRSSKEHSDCSITVTTVKQLHCSRKLSILIHGTFRRGRNSVRHISWVVIWLRRRRRIAERFKRSRLSFLHY